MTEKKKSTILWFVVLLTFSLISETIQYVRDESFHRFCKNVGSSPIKSDTDGDKCVVTWDFPAADLNEAEDYCKTWAAHPLEKYELDINRPKCTYVNVYECRPGYTLIKGYCYRMVRKDLRSYDEAIKDCETQEIAPKRTAQLITIFDNDQLRFIRAFFENLRGFWTRRRNVAERNYAVVYGMAQFYRGAGPGDEIQLRKSDRAQVMCVYQAQETPLSFAAKARMLAPYYYPTLLNGYDTAWRSGNHYSAMISGNVQEVYEVCEKSMRAIVGLGVGTYREPTIVNQASLTADMKKSFNMLYFPVFHCYYTVYNGYNYGYSYYYRVFLLDKGQTSIDCQYVKQLDRGKYDPSSGRLYDQIQSTTAFAYTVSVFPEKVDQFYFLERQQAYRAPIMCKISYTALERLKQCSSGWTPFTRSSGRVVCHKLYKNKPATYDEAREQCKADGARLSTFTTAEEFNTLKTLGGGPTTFRWIGLKKREGCPTISTGRCDSLSIVEFVDDEFAEDTVEVRRAIEAQWPRNSNNQFLEPNNHGQDEMCIELRDSLKLNDLECDRKIHFTCMRNADMA